MFVCRKKCMTSTTWKIYCHFLKTNTIKILQSSNEFDFFFFRKSYTYNTFFFSLNNETRFSTIYLWVHCRSDVRFLNQSGVLYNICPQNHAGNSIVSIWRTKFAFVWRLENYKDRKFLEPNMVWNTTMVIFTVIQDWWVFG